MGEFCKTFYIFLVTRSKISTNIILISWTGKKLKHYLQKRISSQRLKFMIIKAQKERSKLMHWLIDYKINLLIQTKKVWNKKRLMNIILVMEEYFSGSNQFLMWESKILNGGELKKGKWEKKDNKWLRNIKIGVLIRKIILKKRELSGKSSKLTKNSLKQMLKQKKKRGKKMEINQVKKREKELTNNLMKKDQSNYFWRKMEKSHKFLIQLKMILILIMKMKNQRKLEM